VRIAEDGLLDETACAQGHLTARNVVIGHVDGAATLEVEDEADDGFLG
jgi:hypothetical protein